MTARRRKACDTFNLTIEEVRLIVKFRALGTHQQRGILKAVELIRPGAAPPLRPRVPLA